MDIAQSASASSPAGEPAVLCRALHKAFRNSHGGTTKALDGVSLRVPAGVMAALVGPDGAGKTTLLRLIMGLMSADAGDIQVLGQDIVRNSRAAESSVSYMPQKFGLYEDLTVQENLNLYANLHGVSAAARQERYPVLYSMTGLERFTGRLAGRLSGGMKQKLGLACALVQSPRLLVLDEPTVGVDPVSRQELWAILLKLVQSKDLSVLVSTPYLEEAEFCSQAMVMFQGKTLAEGTPGEIAHYANERTFRLAVPSGTKPRRVVADLLTSPDVADAVPEGGEVRLVLKAESQRVARLPQAANAQKVQPHLADGFMVLLRQTIAARDAAPKAERDRLDAGPSKPVTPTPTPPLDAASPADATGPVVEVQNLVRRFGDFVAVDHVNFRINKGEIFGLLGPNGAGKSTTFRMLCGLLPLTSGTLRVAGYDLRRARATARQAVGYVAQKFSLYGNLSVRENLEFFASAYGLHGRRRRDRIAWAIDEFSLGEVLAGSTGRIPDGFKRRLAMACALLHEPTILFLDEPTSGVDPIARREFWSRITAMADAGVTVVVTTHFMEEAEYCDNMVIMMNGRVLAAGAPAEIRQLGKSPEISDPSMQDAFIRVVKDQQAADRKGKRDGAAA